jgi:hypothetical protein
LVLRRAKTGAGKVPVEGMGFLTPIITNATVIRNRIRFRLKGIFMASITKCPSCSKDVSEKAFDCPHCGHPLRKPKRGFFGKIFKWSLILFNLLMIAWLVSYFGAISEQMDTAASEAEQAGAAIGGTIGTGMILTVWVFGDIILGLAALLTRPKK